MNLRVPSFFILSKLRKTAFCPKTTCNAIRLARNRYILTTKLRSHSSTAACCRQGKMERPFFSSHHIPPLLRVSRVKQTDPHGIKRTCLSKNVAEPHLEQLCGNAPAATATCQSPSFPLPRQDQEDARLFGQSQPFIRSVPQPPQRK